MGKKQFFLCLFFLLQLFAYASEDTLKIFLNEMTQLYQDKNYQLAIDQIENYSEKLEFANANDSTIIKLKKLHVEILYVKARIYLKKGDYNQAIVFYNQALIKFNKYKIKDNETEAFLYHIIGFCYQSLEDYKTAGKYFDWALTVDLSEHQDDLINILSDQAINTYHLNNKDLSMYYFREALKIIESKKPLDVFLLAKLYETYGFVIFKYGDVERSEEILLESNRTMKSIYGANSNNIYVVTSDNYLAYFYSQTNRYRKSISYTHEVLKGYSPNFNDTSIYSVPKNNDLVINTNFLYALRLEAQTLYKLYNHNGELRYLESALEHYQCCFYLIEKARFEHMDEESSLSFSKTYKQIVSLALKAALRFYENYKTHDNLESIFRYCEKGKASLLYKAMTDLDAKSNAKVPIKLIEYGKKLDKTIAALKEILKKKPDEKVKTTLYDCVEKKQEYYNLLKNRFPEYYRLRYDLSTITINEIKSRLGDNEVFLEYSLTKDFLICFAITPDSCELFISEKAEDIVDTARDLINLIKAQPVNSTYYEQLKKDSRYLYNQLIQPEKHLIAGKKIIVVPDDILMYLPFDVLLDENEQYLVQSNPVSYAYSATLKYRKKYPEKLTATVGVFAPSYLSKKNCPDKKQLKDLKYARTEAKWVSTMMNGDCFVNDNATEENFINHAKEYSIIHLALHTNINEEDPLLSTLIFSCNDKEHKRGRLKLFELYDLELSNGLVFLGGCGTGYGKLFKGEGLINIARAFLYSGSRSIVFSLWDINDKSGYDIVKSFYSNLGEGYPVDVSLHKAKCHYLDNSVKIRTFPYYWAAYNIVGDNDLTYQLSGKRRFLYIIISLIVLAFVSVLIFRRMKKH